MQERADFHWRMQAEREIMDQEKEAKSRQKQENMEQLMLQIQIAKERSQEEDSAKKEASKTNGGPGLNHADQLEFD